MSNAVWRGGSSALRGRFGRGLPWARPTTAGEAGRQATGGDGRWSPSTPHHWSAIDVYSSRAKTISTGSCSEPLAAGLAGNLASGIPTIDGCPYVFYCTLSDNPTPVRIWSTDRVRPHAPEVNLIFDDAPAQHRVIGGAKAQRQRAGEPTPTSYLVSLAIELGSSVLPSISTACLNLCSF